jgi:hypothetical protein
MERLQRCQLVVRESKCLIGILFAGATKQSRGKETAIQHHNRLGPEKETLDGAYSQDASSESQRPPWDTPP